MTTTDLAGDPPSTLANIRDVSRVSDRLVPGVLLRGDAPYEKDLPVDHSAWPPRTVIDLRDPAEWQSDHHPLEASAEIVSVPLLQGTATSLRELPGSLGDLYTSMLTQPTAALLVDAVTAVACGAAPVLVHCAAGKDRTGVVVALVLRLRDIDRAAIIRDYTATGSNIVAVLDRLARSGHRSSGDDTDVPADLLGAPASAIGAVLDELDSHRGGASGWFAQAGGDPEALAQLRRRLLR